jgi:hypothetical protein
LHVQAAVSGSLSLATTPAEIDGYVMLLRLEPFVDERLVAAVDAFLARRSTAKAAPAADSAAAAIAAFSDSAGGV